MNCADCLLKQIRVLDTKDLQIEWVCEIDGKPAEGRMFCAAELENARQEVK